MADRSAAGARGWTAEREGAFVDEVVRANVLSVIRQIPRESETMRALVDAGRVAIVGVVYDIHTGGADFLLQGSLGLSEATDH